MFDKLVGLIDDIVWCPALIVLLIGAGLYFTIRTRCVQVRRIGLMARLLFAKKGETSEGETKGVSSFQAFCVALSGRVGTGNIIGVATAIAMGGPGAVFWMWVTAFLGASTAFMEATLAQMYKFGHGEHWRGGPFSYIENGLGKRSLGIIFAILTILGYGILTTPVQANGVASAFYNSFGIPPLYIGIAVTVLLALVIIGGIKRIAAVASVVTPFMALAYVIMAVVIIIVNWDAVPGVFASIFKSAFGAEQAFGGIVGSAISFGVKRGLFSNEAGQGGGAIVSASADVDQPAKQGLVQAFSVYIDTLLVCTATALMILCTGSFNTVGPDGEMLVCNNPALGQNYVGFTQAAVDSTFNGFGSIFVSIALAFFVFTTIMAYYFYSESSIMYLCENHYGRKTEAVMIWVFRILMFGMVIFGSCTSAGTVWKVGDIGVGLTTWVNVIVLVILCPKALQALKELETSLRHK